VFSSRRKGVLDIYQKPAKRIGQRGTAAAIGGYQSSQFLVPDGRFILYWSSQNNGDLMVLPFPFLSTPFSELQGAFFTGWQVGGLPVQRIGSL